MRGPVPCSKSYFSTFWATIQPSHHGCECRAESYASSTTHVARGTTLEAHVLGLDVRPTGPPRARLPTHCSKAWYYGSSKPRQVPGHLMHTCRRKVVTRHDVARAGYEPPRPYKLHRQEWWYPTGLKGMFRVCWAGATARVSLGKCLAISCTPVGAKLSRGTMSREQAMSLYIPSNCPRECEIIVHRIWCVWGS